ncbi:hypothetical protein H112_02775 [Trichophyton rubrum D6]|uniref:Ubiquitin carboxyl-terminal hydrolase n=2 Tax=Trichophyton rubrum TaxID=5551 RepID=F2SSF9_TRIRC|nr:uncharacterized protein TERG_05411 [Trichophyton rubrum CBS 118892]EZF24669.1 hypothetical protein H100_02782 [Trichophyton rubrum MR850]EZF43735.1 hypothetical protein H102_02774 [Trichophyton rubrum CBS 100081]EZF54328.1 hypothetical protein H103_02786 [Trichophyton rubrum CBS 288.86]EZF65019.1 hypothetical protein H104_02765 [Trichophyton rubrum CBS 289.86]EZF86365.1 hypothetical protein H110_02784 [Trichophyton rubrum MR1448]EZF96954.1 hypothetical protein H113_02786 [Trichophyton rubr
MNYRKHFIPLESDPSIFTDLMHKLGVSTSYAFLDVWSLEDTIDIPRPVLALLLILPSCPEYEKSLVTHKDCDASNKEVIWMKQTINNACGLYGILHAVCNTPGIIDDGSVLHRLIQPASSDRNAFLEDSKEVEELYQEAALVGRSEAPPAESEVDHHYLCFVKSSGHLYELDGDQEGPIDRGSLLEEDPLLEAGIQAMRNYVNSKTDGAFALLALVKRRSLCFWLIVCV